MDFKEFEVTIYELIIELTKLNKIEIDSIVNTLDELESYIKIDVNDEIELNKLLSNE